MNKKKLLATFMVMTLSVGVFAGCGSAKSESDTKSQVSSTSSQSSVDSGEDGTVIWPLEMDIDVFNLPDGTYNVTPDLETMTESNGLASIDFDVYVPDLYDTVDVHNMKVGDSIYANDEAILLESIEEGPNGEKLLNGGFDMGGYDLRPSESGGTYYISLANDMTTYTLYGRTSYVIPAEAEFWDYSQPGAAKGITGDNLYQYLKDEVSDGDLNLYNTQLVIEGGVVKQILRQYTP